MPLTVIAARATAPRFIRAAEPCTRPTDHRRAGFHAVNRAVRVVAMVACPRANSLCARSKTTSAIDRGTPREPGVCGASAIQRQRLPATPAAVTAKAMSNAVTVITDAGDGRGIAAGSQTSQGCDRQLLGVHRRHPAAALGRSQSRELKAMGFIAQTLLVDTGDVAQGLYFLKRDVQPVNVAASVVRRDGRARQKRQRPAGVDAEVRWCSDDLYRGPPASTRWRSRRRPLRATSPPSPRGCAPRTDRQDRAPR